MNTHLNLFDALGDSISEEEALSLAKMKAYGIPKMLRTLLWISLWNYQMVPASMSKCRNEVFYFPVKEAAAMLQTIFQENMRC